MSEDRPSRWQDLTGGTSGTEYAARFAKLAASGADMHGEATFCAALVSPGARVLDAGCGTGRVAIRLAEQGFPVVGLDVDDSMLAVAREQAPGLTLGARRPGGHRPACSSAGNLRPRVLAGTSCRWSPKARCRTSYAPASPSWRPRGSLVAGFGLDAAHLPRGCPVTSLEEYDAALAAHGLGVTDRFASWDAQPFEDGAVRGDGGAALSRLGTCMCAFTHAPTCVATLCAMSPMSRERRGSRGWPTLPRAPASPTRPSPGCSTGCLVCGPRRTTG